MTPTVRHRGFADMLEDLASFFETEQDLVPVLSEFMDSSTILLMLDSIRSVLAWLSDLLAQIEAGLVSLDSALALLELASDLVEFIAGGLQGALADEQGLDNGFLTELSERLAGIPDVDLSGIDAVASYLPSTTELPKIRRTLRRLTNPGDAEDPGILDSMVFQLVG